MQIPAISPICLGWLCLLAWGQMVAYGQTGVGSISGSLSTPAHAPASGMTVEAKNIETGTFYKAESSPKGEYVFAQLPPGTYEVSVLNLLFRPFLRKDVAVAAGGSHRLDIQLAADDIDNNTLGELAAYFELFAKRPPPPEGPPPRMADGKPDLSGVWLTPPSYAELLILAPPVDLLPWAEAAVRERILNEQRDMPSSRCLPNGEGLNGIFPIEYAQTRTLLVQLLEDVPAVHQVFLDGRSHPSGAEPTWKGHSIGKWEGDTLVIDTAGFNDKSWLFLLVPHTDRLHVIQRLRRPDLGHLEIQTTYDDPGAFKTPVKFTIMNVLAPDIEINEYICENNQYAQHVSAK